MAAGMVQRSAALVTCLFLAIGVVIGSKYRGQNQVKKGEAFNITCLVNLNEAVYWTKDGKNITSELGPLTVEEMKVNDSVAATLTIKNARMIHAGQYQCSKLHETDVHSVKIVRDAQSLTGVYDSENIRAIDYTRTSFNLTCNIDPAVPAPVVVNWFKDNRPLSNTTDLKDRYSIATSELQAVLTIKPVKEDDIGEYACRLSEPPAEAKFTVVGRPYVKLHPNHNVVEGQEIKIVCSVHGKPYPAIKWMYDNGIKNVTLSATERISFGVNEANVPDSLLVLKNAEPADHGTYYCNATQSIGLMESFDKTVLRVKDKYAALWPFIGICAEVIVLCVVILVYEKRRSKNTDMDDSDTDNHDQKKS